MIELFKSYLTKDGKKVVVLEYRGGKYLCSDSAGNKLFLSSDELLFSKNKPKIIEPSYFEENKVSFSEDDFVFKDSAFSESELAMEEQKIDKSFEEGAPFEDFVKILEEPKAEEDIFMDEKPKKTEVEEDDFYGDLL